MYLFSSPTNQPYLRVRARETCHLFTFLEYSLTLHLARRHEKSKWENNKKRKKKSFCETTKTMPQGLCTGTYTCNPCWIEETGRDIQKIKKKMCLKFLIVFILDFFFPRRNIERTNKREGGREKKWSNNFIKYEIMFFTFSFCVIKYYFFFSSSLYVSPLIFGRNMRL